MAREKKYFRYKQPDEMMFFNPSVIVCHFPYMTNATPRNTTGSGRGEGGFNLSHRVGSTHGTSG